MDRLNPFIFFALLFCSVYPQTSAAQVTVRVEFFIPVSEVTLFNWSSVEMVIPMQAAGNNQTFTAVMNTNYQGIGLFNIRYVYTNPLSIRKIWYVAGGEVYTNPPRFDSQGLKYARVFLDGQEIDHSYCVMNSSNGLNISFRKMADGSILPASEAPFFDPRIPAEVTHRYWYINDSIPNPSSQYPAAWMQLITSNVTTEQVRVDVDYLSLYGRRGNGDLVLIAEEGYSQNSSSFSDGGLYYRFPFFIPGYDTFNPMPATISNGWLTFYPSAAGNKIWHWWNKERLRVTFGTYQSFRVVCRLRIIGRALVQAGMDYTPTPAPQFDCEHGAGNWYFDLDGEWQEVVFDSGIVTHNVSFLVTSEGDYPVSQAHVMFNGQVRATNSQGYAVFNNVAPGATAYTIAKTGYQTKTGAVKDPGKEPLNKVQLALVSSNSSLAEARGISISKPFADGVIQIEADEMIEKVEIISPSGAIIQTIIPNSHMVSVNDVLFPRFFLIRVSTSKGQRTLKLTKTGS